MIDLSGKWRGHLGGTNNGEFVLDLDNKSGRIYGTGQFYEPGLGSYRYSIQGLTQENKFVIDLTPEANRAINLGRVHVTGEPVNENEISGRWQSTINTSGHFTASRILDAEENPITDSSKESVFLVHGQDEATKEKVARFVEKLGINVIILHEQISRGQTIIEKFENYSAKAKFAIALLTPDDQAFPINKPDDAQFRARQNVLLELGYFIGKLGRSNTCAMIRGSVELPSDMLGIVYTPIDDDGGWQLKLAKELKDAGYSIDLNKIFA